MVRTGKSAVLAFCLSAFASSFGASHAQEVTITTIDGSIELKGDLLGYDEEVYELRTALGLMRINISMVTCEGEFCPVIKPPTSEFAVSGSSELAGKFMPVLLNAYSNELTSNMAVSQAEGGALFTITDAEADDLASVQVFSSSSTNGVSDLLQGNSAIALTTRPVRRREAEAFSGSGLGNLRDGEQEHVVALDGLVIVTSKENPIRTITQRDAAFVFSGNYTNWSELGGPDAPIRTYIRDPQSGTSEVFSRIVMNPQATAFPENAEFVDSDEEVAALVASDELGIGFTSFAARGDARPLSIEGVCGLVSNPTDFNIKTEEYPLTRRLYAYTTNERLPLHVNGFLDFATSEAAQTAIASAGFVDQGITSSTIDEQGMRFASAIIANTSPLSLRQLRIMTNDMLSSERLSTTFRFETGAARLDTRALDDIVRLADGWSALQMPLVILC